MLEAMPQFTREELSDPNFPFIDKPPHYGQGEIECIDYIRDSLNPEEFQGYCMGNVKKYTHRYRYKGSPVGDLKKALDYLTWAIQSLESN